MLQCAAAVADCPGINYSSSGERKQLIHPNTKNTIVHPAVPPPKIGVELSFGISPYYTGRPILVKTRQLCNILIDHKTRFFC